MALHDCVVAFEGPYGLDQSNTVTVQHTGWARFHRDRGARIQKAFDCTIESKWYGCTFRVIPALLIPLMWGCDARPPDICYFSISPHRRKSKLYGERGPEGSNFRSPAEENTYCVTVIKEFPIPIFAQKGR